MRAPRYGELRCQSNKEIHRLWLTRHDEPQPIPQLFCDSDLSTDPNDELVLDLARRVWSLLPTLHPSQERVLRMRFEDGMTLDEAGMALGVTKERIRQIEAKALRNMRSPKRIGRLMESFA